MAYLVLHPGGRIKVIAEAAGNDAPGCEALPQWTARDILGDEAAYAGDGPGHPSTDRATTCSYATPRTDESVTLIVSVPGSANTPNASRGVFARFEARRQAALGRPETGGSSTVDISGLGLGAWGAAIAADAAHVRSRIAWRDAHGVYALVLVRRPRGELRDELAAATQYARDIEIDLE